MCSPGGALPPGYPVDDSWCALVTPAAGSGPHSGGNTAQGCSSPSLAHAAAGLGAAAGRILPGQRFKPQHFPFLAGQG